MSLFQTIHMSPKGGRGNATIQKEVKLAMAIVRWEPFRDLLAMQDRMSRLFNETFGRDVPLLPPPRNLWVEARAFFLRRKEVAHPEPILYG